MRQKKPMDTKRKAVLKISKDSKIIVDGDKVHIFGDAILIGAVVIEKDESSSDSSRQTSL